MAEKKQIQIFIDETLCKGTDGCGICIRSCPKKVYEKSRRLTPKGIRPPEPVRAEDCTGCEVCMIYCPDLAIVIEKESMTKY
jgi:2-oxoglutarate ferredoxin oxidoreductase subunit delta